MLDVCLTRWFCMMILCGGRGSVWWPCGGRRICVTAISGCRSVWWPCPLIDKGWRLSPLEASLQQAQLFFILCFKNTSQIFSFQKYFQFIKRIFFYGLQHITLFHMWPLAKTFLNFKIFKTQN